MQPLSWSYFRWCLRPLLNQAPGWPYHIHGTTGRREWHDAKAMLGKADAGTAHRGAFASRRTSLQKGLEKGNTSARSESLICQRGMSAFTSSEAMLTGELDGGHKDERRSHRRTPSTAKGSLTIEVKGPANDVVLHQRPHSLRARQAGFGVQSFRSRLCASP